MGLWLPFSLMPKKRVKQTGPRYGDIYPRAMASGIDLGLLFLILNNFFLYTRLKFMVHVDKDMFHQSEHVTKTPEILRLLWESGYISALALSYCFEIFVIGVLYVSVQMLWGTTPGKWIIGLKIVRAHTLEPLAKWRYILRFLAYIPAALPLMIGVLWASFNKERRGWHDYIAGTVVLNTRSDRWYIDQVKKLYFKLRGKKPVSADTPGNTDQASP